ncbi:extracellular solute-binding protein [Microbacterium sp. zg-Y818]|uniref:ABC transporter substrate-binding protein n=2 Tax=Microbacterium TaxID=33882 RepID=UPI00214B61FD|nr:MULTISPECIES: extracellular solute-binding protein [unclassified Microbacterium]MCR2800307.1 extracellular solute-binding protein [Microbacterium sp. zg.Y818]WIM22268.1 extracellular solute-binding protein [Microbacterium sp. zg-Y818]
MIAKRTLAAAAAVTAGVLALAGCSGSGGGAGEDGDVEMTLWHNSTTGPGKEFWDQTAAAFSEENPGVTIKVQVVQNEELDGKLQTALNSGDAPDLFLQRGGGKLAAMVAAGQIKDITDAISDTAAEEIPDTTLDNLRVDDKLYGMPVAVLPGGMFYSQQVFDAAGITEAPTTIDEMSAAVEALKASGVEPIALGGKNAWPAAHWYYFFALRACSPDTMATAAEEMDFSDPCWLEAAENLDAFAQTEPFNQGFLTTEAQQGAGSSAGLIANRLAGMELMGAWNPGVIAGLTPDEKPLPDLSWFPFPEVPGGEGEPGAILGGIDGYSCYVDAPDACVDFLNYLATAEVQEAYYDAFDAPPVNTVAQEAVTEPYLIQIIEAYNEAPFVSQWLDTIYGLNVGNALNVAVVDMLAGNSGPEQLVDAVNAAAAKG